MLPKIWPNEASLKDALRRFGIVVPEGGLVSTIEQAREVAARIGYPVVLKVQSSAIQHKTEVGGVKVGIANGEALEAAWDGYGGQRCGEAPGCSN